jgi:acetyl-CoA C-acetyltransferase
MKVYIKGTGLTKFGELWDKTLDDLILEASVKALQEAKLQPDQIDAIFIGNMLHGKIGGQDHLGALASSLLGINTPAFRLEAACASGGMAAHSAFYSLLSGQFRNVLVIGAEKMTDVSTSQISSALMGAGSEAERQAGLTFPALYALMAKAHMQKYGTTKKHMAAVSVKNHYHASLNPNAQYPYQIDIDRALSAPVVSDPFTVFDSSPITDGAGAIVLSAEGGKGDVYIAASESATDTLDLADRNNLTEIKATSIAAKKAYSKAAIKPEDIDVLEVHDCFTIAEILALEDLGICKKGFAGEFISKGHTKIGGKIPVNTSGGLKACGHPVGATGVKQLIEVSQQLKGGLGQRQVTDPKIGLTQNVGGTGATVVIHILKREVADE